MSNKSIDHTIGSENIYEDLGFEDSDDRLAKARLALRIEQVIKKQKLKQVQAAEILGINQPKISALMNGRLSGFSMERLIHFLNLLDQDVHIIVRDKQSSKEEHGRLDVAFDEA